MSIDDDCQAEARYRRPLRVALSHTLGDANPYITQLADALNDEGVERVPLRIESLWRRHIDVWHLHWPEALARKAGLRRSVVSVLKLTCQLLVARWRRTPIIWTVHNVRGHEQDRPYLDRFIRWVVTRNCNGWISLSEQAAADVVSEMPLLRRRPSVVIPHGHYRSAYPSLIPRPEARQALGLPDDARTVLFFGLIRRYKNVTGLIQEFSRLSDPDLRLVVAGRVMESDLESLIVGLAEVDHRVRLHLGYIKDEDVPTYFSAADLAVFPFTRTLNSGSAVLALSLNCPVLVPNQGSMPALAQEVGSPWVTTYEGDFDADALWRTLSSVERPPENLSPDLQRYDWAAIGADTYQWYQRMARATPGTRRTNSGADAREAAWPEP